MKQISPQKDCFAYEENTRRSGSCKALNDLYCRFGEECPFYKRKDVKKKGEDECL